MMHHWTVLVACSGGGSSNDDSTAVDDSATDDSGADDSGTDDSASDWDLDNDGFPRPEDCDDADETIHPGADEHCDGIDEDCDEVKDDNPVDGTTFHPDLDHD